MIDMTMTHRKVFYLAGLFAISLAVLACGAANPAPVRRPAEATAAEHQRAAAELHRIGLDQERAGDTLRAEEYFASALEAGGRVDDILPDLIRSSVAGQRYHAAIRYFEDYRSQLNRGHRAEFEMVAAALYLGVEQPDRARVALEASLDLQPKNARAQFLLGQLLHDEFQDYAASERHFQAYLQLEPNGENAGIARAGLLKMLTDSQPSGEGREPATSPPVGARSRRPKPVKVDR